jgi:FkbM family methyltransferase
MSSSSWVSCPVELGASVRLEIVVDAAAEDDISRAYRAGQGHLVNRHLLDIMLQLLEPGDAMLDLGGFLGTFALVASAVGCRALAIEANPANAALMRQSAARNRFQEMRVIEAAATDTAGTVSFLSHGPWGRIVESADGLPAAPVAGTPVDQVLEETGWDRVDFVKIDIEGSEVKALRGMNKLLTCADAPPIILESNGHALRLAGSSPQELHRELAGLGYTPYLIEPGCLIELEAGQIQPNTVVDWLAVKGGPPSLEGYRFEPARRAEDLISALLAEGSLPTQDHRAYVAGALAGAPAGLVEDRRIRELLAALRVDPVEAVRRAASWSS